MDNYTECVSEVCYVNTRESSRKGLYRLLILQSVLKCLYQGRKTKPANLFSISYKKKNKYYRKGTWTVNNNIFYVQC